MTVQANLGSLKIRFTGGVTRAYDRAFFNRDECVFGVAAVAQRSSKESVDPFEAISQDSRITNRPISVQEEDSPIKSWASSSTGERYCGARGRLLVFKNSR